MKLHQLYYSKIWCVPRRVPLNQALGSSALFAISQLLGVITESDAVCLDLKKHLKSAESLAEMFANCLHLQLGILAPKLR